MRIRLRWNIMLITVLPLVTLAFATLWIVNRSITSQVDQAIHDDLRRASAVLEDLLAARAQALVVTGEMTVQDPKFFSVLTIPGSYLDPQLRATVSGVARDFNGITDADLFEVTDREGHLIVTVGRDASVPSGRDELVRSALSGRSVSSVLAQPEAHYQVSVTPVYAGGRMVGALLLGERIADALAERLRGLTRSEVTFTSGAAATGSTLESIEERNAVLAAVRRLEHRSGSQGRGGTLIQIHGGSHLYLTLIRPLPLSDPRQNQFYIMQRAIDSETAFLRETQSRMVVLGIAALLVALLAGFLIAERITSPVQRLVRGAEEMEQGNYDFPLAVSSGNEIGQLATRFENMRRRQREYVHSLEEVARVKSEFLSVASHELRTPISVIRGFHELLLAGNLGAITVQQRQALEATGRSIEKLIHVAEDATRMAQINRKHMTLERTDCDVPALVDQAMARVRALASGRRVALHADVENGLGKVQVDGPSIIQALVNLVSNGIRFTPDGGRVDVRATRDRTWLVISVVDSGIGIEAERQQDLLERPFNVQDTLNHHSSSTLEFNSAGLGLGLPIARGILEAHGGNLRLESLPGRGTTIEVRIPIELPNLKEAA